MAENLADGKVDKKADMWVCRRVDQMAEHSAPLKGELLVRLTALKSVGLSVALWVPLWVARWAQQMADETADMLDDQMVDQ